jgi:spore germination cell wall hydrolase CwlJ-like protein
MNIIIDIKMLNIRFVIPVLTVFFFTSCLVMVTDIRAREAQINPYEAEGYVLRPKSSSVAKSGVPTELPILLSEGEKDLIARTIWGEARNQSFQGKVAIAEVILTRMRALGCSAEKVIKAKKQFSCWNPRDPNRRKMLRLKKDSSGYLNAMKALEAALAGSDSKARGASHYHTNKVKPKWANGQKAVASIGHHRFYCIRT